MTPEERAALAVKAVRGDELFDVPSDARWQREIAQAIRDALAEALESRRRFLPPPAGKRPDSDVPAYRGERYWDDDDYRDEN